MTTHGGRGNAAASSSSSSSRPQPALRHEPAPHAPAPHAPQQPVALLYGSGHKIVHANPAFVAEFGEMPIGVPASEALIDFPPIVLKVVDRVLTAGRPLATWVSVRGTRRRLTVAPRTDPETGEVYGVALRLARE